MFKNVASQKVAVFAWDNAAGAAKTGDAGNITAQISIDGAACAATDDANPAELDATDAPGIYLFSMTQAETNGDLIVVYPVSSTSDIVLRPVIIYTKLTVQNVLDGVVEGSYTLQDMLKFAVAFAAGKASGGGSGTITFRDTGDSYDRIVMSVDANGNRSSVTLDAS